MTILYTLRYFTKAGSEITLYNLSSVACDLIERVQVYFGSYDFRRSAQPYDYSQQQIDLLNKLTGARS